MAMHFYTYPYEGFHRTLLTLLLCKPASAGPISIVRWHTVLHFMKVCSLLLLVFVSHKKTWCWYRLITQVFLAPRLTLKLEDHPLVGCPRLLIQYILQLPSISRGLPSIRNLRTHLTWHHGVSNTSVANSECTRLFSKFLHWDFTFMYIY